MNLQQIKEIFPYGTGKGDLSFIESLLTLNLHVFHIDSYNNESGKRFQGVFYYSWGNGRTYVTENCPIEILKHPSCKRFQLTQNKDHIVWTIWFD